MEVVSFTTRPMRVGEVEGKDYNFLTFKEFCKLEDVVECRGYTTKGSDREWYYGIRKSGFKDENGKYILIATLESFRSIEKYFPDDSIIPIYIKVGDETRLERMMIREKKQGRANYREICRRFLADDDDFMEADSWGKYFINDDLNKCVEEIIEYIRGLSVD